MPRRPPAARPLVPYVPQLDGLPRRAWGSWNVRHEDKRRLDLVHAWLCKERGAPLTQWDVFSLVLAGFLAHAGDALPEELRRLLE